MRCFIALDLDPEPGPALAGWLEELRGYRELRVPPPGNMHLTLAFLGELDDAGVDLAAAAVAGAAGRLDGRWSVEWAGAGAFPSLRRPDVLWLGVADEAATARAASLVSEELAARGLPVESRRFRPHLTVGRVRRGVRGGLGASLEGLLARVPVVAPSQVTGLVLYRSQTGGRRGSVYTRLATESI